MRGTVRQRFEAKFIRGADCWLWVAAKDQDGYGRMRVEERPHLAQRISWQLYVGPIPEGMKVLHHCDNPPCVNPEHLFLGDQKLNMEDMQQKGRKAVGHATNHAKLHENTVIRVRILGKAMSPTKVARALNVSLGAIYGILDGRSWTHVSANTRNAI